MIADSSNQASNPIPKRSLFTRPAWSRPQKTTGAEKIFHRSSSSHVDLAAEAERKRKAKLAKQQIENSEKAAYEDIGWKRRRLSSDSEYESDNACAPPGLKLPPKTLQDGKVDSSGADPQNPKAVAPDAVIPQNLSTTSVSNKYEATMNAGRFAAQQNSSARDIIDLEDDNEEDIGVRGPEPTATEKSIPTSENDEFLASDDEYAELARRAREKARTKPLEYSVVSTTNKTPLLGEPRSLSQPSLSQEQPASPLAAFDPEIYILITSRLKNTKPLIIKRQLSQRLKDVRITWCQHQQFTADMTNTVFLTWRGKRLFDVTSCKSLGIAVDVGGNVTIKGQEDMFGEEEQRIHMEAMTEVLLEKYKIGKRQRMEEPEVEEQKDARTPQKPQEAQLRIILKAKGFEDFKLIVKSVSASQQKLSDPACLTVIRMKSTSVSRIVAAFRQANQARTENKDVFLIFDGDRLEPNVKAGETELSDMDHIDVYVK